MKILLRYSLFAGIAIVLNLASQEITYRVYPGAFNLYLAILVGTAVGLISKYQLDKHFIFAYRVQGVGDDLNRFMAYSLTGVITTLVFWGFELGFDALFGTRAARYGGAILGLTLGYLIKYRLDRRFVFSNRTV